MTASAFSHTPDTEAKFQNPEQELAFLRNEVARREEELRAKNETPVREGVIAEQVKVYREQPMKEVLHKNFAIPENAQEEIGLGLSPETHDTQMRELLKLLHEKGVLNTLRVVEKMNSPHLEDDFERLLVQYIKAGFPPEGLKESNPLFKGLSMTLYEVSLPEHITEGKEKQLKELISGMEQFYAGMLSVADGGKSAQYFTIELAEANYSDEFVFYAAVPNTARNLFEKQILSIFHDARIREHKDDYNVFNEKGYSVAAYATSGKNPIFPLKTYEQFDHDPLGVLLNSFSKIDRDGEGAAVQIVFQPFGDEYMRKYKRALEQIKKGVKVKEAIDIPDSVGSHLFHFVKEVAKEFKNEKKKKTDGPEPPPPVDDVAVEQITLKTASPVVKANIRIVASSHTEAGAKEILSHIEAAFNQFENTHGNKLTFTRTKGGGTDRLLREFTFRLFSEDERIPLNIKELTSVMHFPSSGIGSAPQLKIAKAGSAAAPVDLPQQGILLGINRFRAIETKVFMAEDDRLRHMYAIGQTGTGKSTLLKNMIVQDVLAGHGVAYIDPHGSDIQDVLASIPKERYEDVIYFDPGYTARPMGLNMLEFDENFPEQKTFVVNELFSIFKKVYGAVPESMGPAFEQYFRNSALLVMEHPESGNTLLDVSRVLSDKNYREYKLSVCKNPLVLQFWQNAIKTTGDQGLANYVQYVTNKFDIFLANDIMRPIVSQEHSAFNFREVMDNKKILLVNLAKGKLGDINSHLIGLILVGKILMAALSRVDSFGATPGLGLPPFYLYIDEFQNVTTDSIATILSEARKYKLSLTIAHQFISQLEEGIKNAVFGNVGSMVVFRIGAEDTEQLQKQFDPVFTPQDLMNLDNRNAYLKLLVNGRPVKPFNIETLPPPAGAPAIVERLKELSYLKFGRDRAEVEAEIMKKYQPSSPVAKI